MRRTAALFVTLPLALLTVGGLAGPSGPDAGADVPIAAAPTPSTADRVGPAAPVEPAEPEQQVATEGPEADETGPTGSGTGTGGAVGSTFLIAAVPDSGAVAGTGPRWRYTIEVEPELGVDVEAVAVEVRAALTDERSWVRTRTLEQVDDPARARIRVVLASPDTVDELCGRAGLRTAGIYSCWNGRFAALNSWRWEVGADAFDDITTYRAYLVNHEFGHGLGYGHVGCPAEDVPAPVMMQQSKGVGSCIANGWPYP